MTKKHLDVCDSFSYLLSFDSVPAVSVETTKMSCFVNTVNCGCTVCSHSVLLAVLYIRDYIYKILQMDLPSHKRKEGQ